MKTFQGATIYVLIAALTLSCESVHFHQPLNSINDLKKVKFGQSVPKHSLLLLYWFANVINIHNQYNTITMTFDPNTNFGSHHFANYEDMLERLPSGSHYFTVGNLNERWSNQLPQYVRQSPDREYDGRNQDRIIFSAVRQRSGAYIISRVYLTQHIPRSNGYDPEHIYQISTNLLREIRQFSNGDPTALRGLRNQFHSGIGDSQMMNLRATWGDNLVGLALLLFIVIQEKYSRPVNTNNYPQRSVPTKDKQSVSIQMPGSSYSDMPRQTSSLLPCLFVVAIFLFIILFFLVY